MQKPTPKSAIFLGRKRPHHWHRSRPTGSQKTVSWSSVTSSFLVTEVDDGDGQKGETDQAPDHTRHQWNRVQSCADHHVFTFGISFHVRPSSKLPAAFLPTLAIAQQSKSGGADGL